MDPSATSPTSGQVSLEQVHSAIRRVVDPCSIATGVPIDLIDMGLLKSVALDGHRVQVTLILTSPMCWQITNIVEALTSNLREIPGVRVADVQIDTADMWMPDMMAPSAQARLRRVRPLPAPRLRPVDNRK
jgi:metal-sulfur cluster biosynthetic enzyme